ncbi:MAG: dienelactone hydrolase family protein [Acetobacteraceae bacterium]
MQDTSVRVRAHDGGEFEAFLATPSRGKGPGIVLLAEVYNANHWAREVGQGYAEAGFVTLTPDLYWRKSPGEYLSYTPEGQQRGRDLGFTLDLDLFIHDLKTCVAWLRARPECNGHVGAVGFCLGGKLVYLGMARHVLEAGVGYYPVHLENFLDDAKTIEGRLMMHFGSLDHRVPPDLYRTICERLEGKPDIHNYWYEGADHGFNRHGYPPYHPDAAALARPRTLEFLSKHLGEPAR